jgi:hypothetical protein
MPQAWIAHRVMRVNTDGELRRAIRDPGLRLAETAIVLNESVPVPEWCEEAEPVAVARPDSGTVALTAIAACRGILILTETNYPGWQATVNGKPAPILEVYGAFRGVPVEAGPNEVVMRYRPGVVKFGAFVSCVGLAAAALLVRRRSESHANQPGRHRGN